MQVKNEPKLNEDVDRDIFWTKIDFLLNNSKELIILALVSHEYLRNHYGSHDKNKAEVWLKTTIQKWQLSEDELNTLDKNQFYDIYVNSSEGHENAIKFLRTKQDN